MSNKKRDADADLAAQLPGPAPRRVYNDKKRKVFTKEEDMKIIHFLLDNQNIVRESKCILQKKEA